MQQIFFSMKHLAAEEIIIIFASVSYYRSLACGQGYMV